MWNGTDAQRRKLKCRNRKSKRKNDSDIDILIELKKDLTDIYEKKSLLKEIMEKAFDKKVDIAREKYLKPLVKDEVLKEVKYV